MADPNPSPHNLRRARRRRIEGTVLVTDAMTDDVVGRLGNLSETGMLLIARAPLTEDALYQFRYTLPLPGGGQLPIEAGMHALWQDRGTGSGQAWVGLRVIALPDVQLEQLRAWLDAPGARYD